MACKQNVAIITYNMYALEGKNGYPCHGKSDRSIDPKVMYAPRLLRKMVLLVETMYDMVLLVDMVF